MAYDARKGDVCGTERGQNREGKSHAGVAVQ